MSDIKKVTIKSFQKAVKQEQDTIAGIMAAQVTLITVYADFCKAHGLLKDNGLPTQAGKDIALAFSAPALVKEFGSYPVKEDTDNKLVSLDDAARKLSYAPAVFMRNAYISLRKQQRAEEDAKLTPAEKAAKKEANKKGADKKKNAIVVKKGDIDTFIKAHPEAFFVKHEEVFAAMVDKFTIDNVDHPLFAALTSFSELAQTITAQIEGDK